MGYKRKAQNEMKVDLGESLKHTDVRTLSGVV